MSELRPLQLPGADVDRPDEFAVVHTDRAPKREFAQRFCNRMVGGLDTAELFWVSKEFTALALESARDLPDLTFMPEEMPSPSGLVVYEAPVLEVSRTVITAVTWVPVPRGVWVTLYTQPEFAWPHQRREILALLDSAVFDAYQRYHAQIVIKP